MSKRTKVIILVVVILLLGFLRDYLFLNINEAYKTVQWQGLRTYHGRDEFAFMLDWPETQFVTTKWIGTFIFFGLYFFFTWFIVMVGFQNKTYSKIALLAYTGIFVISGLLFVVGFIFGFSIELYDVIHTIMMFGQSFMPLIILALLFQFYPKIKEQQS